MINQKETDQMESIGIKKGFKKTGTRVATAEITDIMGCTLSKGQVFFVLEMKMKRPSGFPVNIAIDNGTGDDALYPVTAISEDDYINKTKETE